MTIQFPLFPDDMHFAADNRLLMSNHQILTRVPEDEEEASFVRYSNFADLPGSSRQLPQSQRQRYASVKRALGGQADDTDYNVKTYERSFKKSVREESQEKAKRYLRDNQPKKLKGYISPLDRRREQQGFQREAEPIVVRTSINEARMEEYHKRQMDESQKRQAVNINDRRMTVEQTQELQAANARRKRDLFSREQTDYFKQKRDSLFNRGV